MKELCGKVAQKVGMCQNWELVHEQSSMIPMVVLVSSSSNQKCHVQPRLFLDNKCHPSMAGAGTVCTAACTRVKGSVVNELLSKKGLWETTIEI